MPEMSKKRMMEQKKRFFRKIGCTPFLIDFVIFLNKIEQFRHTMKTKLPLKTVGALALCLSFSHTMQGATLHWDVNAVVAGSGNAGGTWDSGITSNWSSAATGDVATTTFTDGDIAVFSSGTDGTGSWTVNVSGLVQAGGITFEEDGSKNINGGTIALAANTTISAAGRGNGNNYTINSLLNGAGNLTIAANGDTSDSGGGIGGNVTLGNSANNFTGNVTITSGVVSFSDNGAFGDLTNDIVIQGGGIVATGNRALPSTRDIVLSGGGDKIFRLYGSATCTIEGAISGTGNVRHTDGGNLVLNGLNTFTGNIDNTRGNLTLGNSAHVGNVNMFTGTLALTAGNTYTGITHMRGSNILRLDADNALPDGTYSVFWGGTRFNVNGKTDTTGALTTGSSVDTNVVMDLGTGANLTVTNNNLVADTFGGYGNATWDGTIIGSGNITYAHATATGGAAQWDVRNANNTFTGNWTIANGRLRIQPATLADSSLGNVENDIIFDGAIVDTMNNGGGSASLQVTNGQSVTHPATRTVTLNNGKEGTFYVWGGTTTTVEGIITGGGNLRKEDSGTLTLNNTGNNYTGETKIILGTINLGANDVLPDATLLRIGGGGSNLNMNGKNDSVMGLSSVQVSDSSVLTNGTVYGAGNLTITGSGNYEFGGSYSPNSSGSLVMNGSGTQILSGTGDNGGGFATVNSGTLVLAKASSTNVHAIGASNTTGLTINSGGTVKIAGTGGDQIYIETNVTVNGIFDLGGLNEGFRGIAGSGTITNTVPETSSMLTIGQSSVNGNQYTFDGEFVNGAADAIIGLNKVGIGTLILTGNSTHTGFTDVTNGLLIVDGSLSDSQVYVMDTAVLAGNGSLGENLTVSTGGGLGTELLDWDGPAGTGYSDLSITGSISFGGGSHTILVKAPSLSNFTEADRVFTIATSTSGITGFNAADFTVNPVNFPGNGTWAVRVAGNNLELVYTKVAAYTEWVGTYGLSSSTAAFDYDYDGDGIGNGLEFVLGGDPSLANDISLPVPVITGSGASRTVTIEYPRLSTSAYLNPVLEFSNNLDTWNTAVDGANGASIVITSNFYATGLDKVTVTLPAEGARSFTRISVTNP